MRAQTSPVRCPVTLDRVADDVSAAKGVSLADLEPLTTLLVRTRNSLYRILVCQAPSVRVEGGRYFPRLTEGRLNGSGFGGSVLKVAWIGVGLRMEIYSHGRRIITSPVRAIETEPAPYASRPQ